MSKTSYSKSKTIKIIVEVNGNEKQCWEMDCCEEWVYDANYGADADGKRGIGQWDCNDLIVSEVRKDGEIIKEKDLPEYISELFEKVIENETFEPQDNRE